MDILEALKRLDRKDFLKRQAKGKPRVTDWAEGTETDRLAEASKGKGAIIEQPYLTQDGLGMTTESDVLWSGENSPEAMTAMRAHSNLSDEEWAKVADLKEGSPLTLIEALMPDDVKRDVKAHEQRHATLQPEIFQAIIEEATKAGASQADVEEALVRFNDKFAAKTDYMRDKSKQFIGDDLSPWYAVQRAVIQALDKNGNN